MLACPWWVSAKAAICMVLCNELTGLLKKKSLGSGAIVSNEWDTGEGTIVVVEMFTSESRVGMAVVVAPVLFGSGVGAAELVAAAVVAMVVVVVVATVVVTTAVVATVVVVVVTAVVVAAVVVAAMVVAAVVVAAVVVAAEVVAVVVVAVVVVAVLVVASVLVALEVMESRFLVEVVVANDASKVMWSLSTAGV